jgi:hypothetical protein
MAALEYLTLNSLTSYPFRKRQPSTTQLNHPLSDDWFYDILFVSYDNAIRRVFISRLEKTNTGALRVIFTNLENLEPLNEIIISPENLVNHRVNTDSSFAYASFARFSVKFVFGAGLVEKDAFSQVYSYSSTDRYVETELSSGAIILNAPRVDNINFEAYDTVRARDEDVPDEPFIVAAYPSLTELPIVVSPRHNSSFILTSINVGDLYVAPGLGAGLYDPCTQKGEITDVYSVNRVFPNTEGALFLKTSNCYVANVLTANDEILLGEYLDPYREFVINLPDGDTANFDAVHAGHGIYLQNFCKPKCAPEILGAFAHYLNRIEDASKELANIAFSATELRGKCSETSSSILSTSFCVLDADNPFVRCSDPSHPEYVHCSTEGFKKYFHEGRTLQVQFNVGDVREFKIIEVVSPTSVKVDKPLGGASNLYFRVVDNGVIGNMNCAVSAYNQGTETILNPYFKVKHTTTEAYAPSGDYVTYLTLAVAIFNPSSETVGISVAFNPTALTRQGDFKVRTKETVSIVDTPSVTLGCRDYAFIEAVYYIKCETYNGELDIDVFNVTKNNTKIGDTYTIANIDGAGCPDGGLNAGGSVTYDVSQGTWASFEKTFTVANLASIQSAYGDIPSWIDYGVGAGAVTLNITSRPTQTSTKTFIFFLKFALTTVGSIVYRITLNYKPLPVILSPLAKSYTSSFPLNISSDTIYTAEEPLLQVIASNMTSDTQAVYSASMIGATDLPGALVFNTQTGVLTGSLGSQVLDNTSFSILLSCSNSAGAAADPQVINLAVKSNNPPVIAFSAQTPGPSFAITNLVTYTSSAPLIALQATNAPIFEYSLVGELPTGLLFNNATGQVIGKLTETSSGSRTVYASARNVYGSSSLLPIDIIYTVGFAPTISYPVSSYNFNVGLYSTTTLSSPLFTVAATQALGGTNLNDANLPEAARNVYSAAGLPPGFQIAPTTGKVYGSLSSTEIPTEIPFAYSKKYNFTVYVTNPVGRAALNLSVTFSATSGPVINNIAENSRFTVSKNKTYTKQAALFRITAIGTASFSAENLPPGLTCSPDGYIIGTVQNAAVARQYSVKLHASNADGDNTVNCTITVPISIVSPVTETNYNLQINQANANIAQILTCSTYDNATVTLTAESLPPGITLVNNTLAGTPTQTGSYLVKISASTADYETSAILLNIAVLRVLYSITGRVASASLVPVAGVKVSIDSTRYATTGSDGTYQISTLSPGSYSLIATKDNYYIAAIGNVTIGSSNVTGVNFTATGPARTISGSITTSSGIPIEGAAMSGGINTPTSNTDGSYVVYVEYDESVVITPSSAFFAFSPSTYSVSAGAANLGSINFTAAPASIPTEPTSIQITSNDGSLSVGFTAPVSDGGSAIVRYEYSLDGASFVSGETAVSPVNITGLTNGTTYSIRLRAVNATGAGVTSLTYTAVPYTVPGAPTIVSPIAGYDKQLLVRITENAVYAGTPTTDLEYSTDGGTTFISSGVASSPININKQSSDSSALLNAVAYSIVVRASNIKGIGASSAAVSGTPVSDTTITTEVAGAPTGVTYVPGDKSVTISFTPPVNTGGVAILNYRYSVDNGANFTTITPATGAVSSFTITKNALNEDLVNGQVYPLYIGAITIDGELPVTGTSLLVKPGKTPEVPTNISVGAGSKRLLISFGPPANTGGYDITGYQYSVDGGAFVSTNSTESLIVITNLNNGQSYSIRIRAVNSLGVGAISTPIVKSPVEPPSPPSIVTPVETYNGGVRFDFNAPTSTGGAAISRYEYSLTVNESWLVATILAPQAGGTGRIQIANLSNGINYPLRLRAVNAAGSVSPSSTAVRFTPIGVPTAPYINSLNQLTSTSFRINFQAPVSNGGGDISGYIYSTNNGVSYSSKVTTRENAIIVTGLTLGSTYNVVLKAVNSAGNGLASVAISITMYLIYSPPTIITPIISKDQGLDVTFTAPSNAPFGLGVSYQYSINGGLTWSTAAVTLGTVPNTLKTSITGLNNGQLYSIALRAKRPTSNGEQSDLVSAYPALVPGIPTNINVASGDGKLIVSFTAPSTGGSPIIDYKCSLNNGPLFTLNQNSSPLTISSLRNGSPYYVRIAAVNLAGTGELSSNPQNTTMPGITPAAPTNVKINTYSLPGGHITFTVPDSGTNSITGYDYSLNNGLTWTTVNSTAQPLNVPSASLTVGTEYYFKIRAFSTLGKGAESGVITKKWGTPEEPTELECTTTSLTIANAYFKAPNAHWLTPVQNYEYRLGANLPWKTVQTGTDIPLAITDLKEKVSYNLQVRAINSVGAGLPSDVFILNQGSPSAPTVYRLELVYVPVYRVSKDLNYQTYPSSSGNSITGDAAYGDATYIDDIGNKRYLQIYFIPCDFDGGSAIASYEYSFDGGETFKKATADEKRYLETNSATEISYATDLDSPLTAYIPAVVDPVDSGVTVNYDIRIRAINANGNIGYTSKKYTEPPTPPSEVEVIKILRAGKLATVFFNAPIIKGAPSVRYQYAITAINMQPIYSNPPAGQNRVLLGYDAESVGLLYEAGYTDISEDSIDSDKLTARITLQEALITFVISIRAVNSYGMMGPSNKHLAEIEEGLGFVNLYRDTINPVTGKYAYTTYDKVKFPGVAVGFGDGLNTPLTQTKNYEYSTIAQAPTVNVSAITSGVNYISIPYTFSQDAIGVYSDYRLEYSLNGGVSYNQTELRFDGTPLIIAKGLAAGSTYTVRLRVAAYVQYLQDLAKPDGEKLNYSRGVATDDIIVKTLPYGASPPTILESNTTFDSDNIPTTVISFLPVPAGTVGVTGYELSLNDGPFVGGILSTATTLSLRDHAYPLIVRMRASTILAPGEASRPFNVVLPPALPRKFSIAVYTIKQGMRFGVLLPNAYTNLKRRDNLPVTGYSVNYSTDGVNFSGFFVFSSLQSLDLYVASDPAADYGYIPNMFISGDRIPGYPTLSYNAGTTIKNFLDDAIALSVVPKVFKFPQIPSEAGFVGYAGWPAADQWGTFDPPVPAPPKPNVTVPKLGTTKIEGVPVPASLHDAEIIASGVELGYNSHIYVKVAAINSLGMGPYSDVVQAQVQP